MKTEFIKWLKEYLNLNEEQVKVIEEKLKFKYDLSEYDNLSVGDKDE